MTRTITIVVNGQDRTIQHGASLNDLLHVLDLDARMVVVEHNQIIVRRPKLETTTLSQGDHVELVQLVGGG